MVEPGALETCHPEQPFEASKLVRTRAQRIPSRSRASAHTKTGYICADPTVYLHFSLATRRRTIHSGLPVLRPECRTSVAAVAFITAQLVLFHASGGHHRRAKDVLQGRRSVPRF